MKTLETTTNYRNAENERASVSVMPGQTVDRLYLKLLGDRPQRVEVEFILPGRGGGNALQPLPVTSTNHQSP